MESKSTAFLSKSVLDSYIATENILAGILQTVPYYKKHENVWSPALVTILLESCSQLDSLWEYQAKQSPCVVNRNLSIKHYFSYFGERISPKWVVFWGEEPEKIHPYDSWAHMGSYKPEYYQQLDWWTAYNKVKHNRLANRTRATLRNAVRSLAGLFLAILGCEFCHEAIAQANWLSGNGHNLKVHLNEDSPSTKLQWVVAESKLFSYPVGWAKEQIPLGCYWDGPASLRFINWFDQHSTEK